MIFLFSLLLTIAYSQGKDISEHMCLGDNVGSNVQELVNEKVKFQFLYESLCPYSIDVYVNQLEPAVMELAPYLDITTYPFGNAYMTLNESQLTIECQHGEEECYGNRLHACAVNALKDPTKYVPFNACMMGLDNEETSHDDAADTCGRRLQVNSHRITSCAKNIQGFELLLRTGIESGNFNYSGVPSWFVNGEPQSENDERTLKEILCDALKNPPNVCNEYFNK